MYEVLCLTESIRQTRNKECLQYTLDAINTEEAACEAKKQAAEHYTEFELFDVQSIGEVRT